MTSRHGYLVHSVQDRKKMLNSMALESVQQLFSNVPDSIRLKKELSLPPAMSEWQLSAHMRQLAHKNTNLYQVNSFLGGGMYEHHIPAVVDSIAEKGEFLTAYTPYQPEMSQGLLQVLAEYQSFITAITGLPIVNSSSYDGSTALAEAISIGCQSVVDRHVKVVLSEHIWPQSIEVVKSYMQGRNISFITCGGVRDSGQLDLNKLNKLFSQYTPSILVLQSPNSLGCIEQLDKIVSFCHQFNVTSVLSYHPMLSGLMVPPGHLGIDIVCGEGQPLGIPLSSGGPSLGLLACKKEFEPFMAGRIVGKVADIYGNPAYSLVHEEREQHMAREKATSNICSNQALCALRAAVYLSTLGDSGLQQIAKINLSHSHYLAEKLFQIEGVKLAYNGSFFNEFCLSLPCQAEHLVDMMKEYNVLAGIPHQQQILIAVTEIKNKNQLDDMVHTFSMAIKSLVRKS